jgi:surface antigen
VAGQCTQYASERYHQLTGFWVPWSANASGWYAGAVSFGWSASGTPPRGIPSIIVLQPFVQLASALGHVAVVEQVNGDGTVNTSGLNWGPDAAAKAQIAHVTFRTGPGVSFVWAAGGSIPTNSGATGGTGTTQLAAAQTGNIFSALGALSGFFSSIGGLSPWLGNPLRLVKMAAGVLLIFAAILLLVAPEAEKVAGAALPI